MPRTTPPPDSTDKLLQDSQALQGKTDILGEKIRQLRAEQTHAIEGIESSKRDARRTRGKMRKDRKAEGSAA